MARATAAMLTDASRPVRRLSVAAADACAAGAQMIPFQSRTRQELYDLELEAFLRTIAGQQEPDRLPEHDLLVQETLLGAVGTLVDR